MELRIEHLGFSYRKDRILRDISFYARGGEVTAIIGANAVGKSTLLCLLYTSDAADEL